MACKAELASKDLCGHLNFIALRDRISVLQYFCILFLSTSPRNLAINAQWATEVLKLLQAWTAAINRLVHYILLTVCKYAIFNLRKNSCSSLARSQSTVQGPDFKTTYFSVAMSGHLSFTPLPSSNGGGPARGSNTLAFGLGGRVGAACITGVLALYLKAPTLRQSHKVVSSPRADPISVSFWIYNLICTGGLP